MTRQEADKIRFVSPDEFEATDAEVAMFTALCVAGVMVLCVGIYWVATL